MTGLTTVAKSLERARNQLAAAMQNAELAAVQANVDGMAEAKIAREIGVNRLTVRRWLGK